MLAGRTTGMMDRAPRFLGGMGCGFASYSSLQPASSHCDQKFWNANEIVGASGEDEEPFHQVAPAMSGLAQAANGLHPPKRFFDPLALDCADTIAGIDRKSTRLNSSHVRI